MVATPELIEETIRNHNPPKDSPDISNALASDLHAPISVCEGKTSPLAIFSNDKELRGLLQVGTLAPVSNRERG